MSLPLPVLPLSPIAKLATRLVDAMSVRLVLGPVVYHASGCHVLIPIISTLKITAFVRLVHTSPRTNVNPAQMRNVLIAPLVHAPTVHKDTTLWDQPAKLAYLTVKLATLVALVIPAILITPKPTTDNLASCSVKVASQGCLTELGQSCNVSRDVESASLEP